MSTLLDAVLSVSSDDTTLGQAREITRRLQEMIDRGDIQGEVTLGDIRRVAAAYRASNGAVVKVSEYPATPARE